METGDLSGSWTTTRSGENEVSLNTPRNTFAGNTSWFDFQSTVPLWTCSGNTPHIYTMTDGNFNGNLTRISPFGLYEGEEDIVGQRLAEELKKL